MNKLRKVVITAAGRGTRQYPATNTVQKELFPLVDIDGYTKPTLQIVVEEALASGIEEVCVIANGTNADPIQHHFRGLRTDQKQNQFAGKDWANALSDSLDNIGSRLTLIIQDSQEGYGHAVFQAREWVGDEPFLLLVGDHIYLSKQTERCARQVISVYEQTGAPVFSVHRRPEREIGRYGTISAAPIDDAKDSLRKIVRLSEKPGVEYARKSLRSPGLADGEYFVFFGAYVLPSRIFDILGQLIAEDARLKGEIQLTSALERLLQSEPCYAAEVAGDCYDMGIPEGLVQTQLALALRSPYRDFALALCQAHG